MEKLYQLRVGVLWDAFNRERASFWLLCFYVFIEYVRPQSVYPAIDVIPWAKIAVLLTIVFFFLENNRLAVKNKQSSLVVLFSLVVLLSSAFAYSPQDAFDQLHIFLSWVIVYYLVINIVNTQSRFFIFLVLFVLWNFKMTQHGFLSWASRGFAFARWGVTGAPGWFHNSGEFGIQLCIFIPLSLYFIHALRRHWGKRKLLLILALPFTAVASVVATSSRGALVGAAAAILWMMLKSKSRFAVALLLVLPLAFAVYSVIPAESMQRFEASGVDNTSVTRLKRWKDGIEIMNEHPMLGIGYFNWMRYHSNYADPDMRGLSHNIFVDAGAELGYPGLALFALMIVFTFITNAKTRKIALDKKNEFLYYMAHAFDAGMVGFIISGSFVSVLYYPYFWVATAFTVALHNIVLNEQKNDEIGVQQETRFGRSHVARHSIRAASAVRKCGPPRRTTS